VARPAVTEVNNGQADHTKNGRPKKETPHNCEVPAGGAHEPLTPTDARNKFCYQEWQRGQQYKEILAALKKRPDWADDFSHERAVRCAIKAWAKKHTLPVRKGQPGRPAVQR
jgi:hypothetical protein